MQAGDRTGRPDFRRALEAAGVLTALSDFDPHVAGTPPLGIDIPGSDIDVLCHAPDPAQFVSTIWQAFRHRPRFSIRQWVRDNRAVIAQFEACGWTIELFGMAKPVAEQVGWRHFLIERRLLGLGGPALAARIIEKKRAGSKTEPAFAAVLGLGGDPYTALLALEPYSNAALRDLLEMERSQHVPGKSG